MKVQQFNVGSPTPAMAASSRIFASTARSLKPRVMRSSELARRHGQICEDFDARVTPGAVRI